MWNNRLVRILVGNKCDRTNERQIIEKQGKNYQKNRSIDYFYETSSLNGYNIDKLFTESWKIIYKLITKKENEEYPGIKKYNEISLSESIIRLKMNPEEENDNNDRNNNGNFLCPKEDCSSNSCCLF